MKSLVLFSASLVCAAVIAGPSSAAGLIGGVNLVGGGPTDTSYQLSSPSSIARLGDGSFFVLDSANQRVVKLDSAGKFLFAFGGPSSGNSGTQSPTSLALIGGGASPDVIVGNGSGVIKRFTSTGTFVSKFTLPASSAAYVAVDPACGELYVSETASNRVQRFAIEDNLATGPTEQFGDLLETFGQGAGISDSGVQGKLWYPHNIAFDSTGRVFVADGSQWRVSVFAWSGNCGSRTHSYDSKFGNNSSGSPEMMLAPQAIAIDRSVVPNKIYVSQVYLDNIIQAYAGGAPSGLPPFVYQGRWGTTVPYGTVPGSGPDDLSYPSGIALNGSDAWITESGNDRVHLYTGVSASTPFTAPTSAGTWGHSPREDGYFIDSGQLATADDGSVFAIDRQKKRIQHFSPRGQLIAAWGESGTGPGQFDSNPSAIAVTPSGEVLVSGSVAGIQRFSADGTYLGVINWTPQSAPDPNAPGPIAVDGAGHIWVFDFSGMVVVKLDSSGTVLASFGGSGYSATDGTFSTPTDLAVSADGLTVYVSDYGTALVKKFVSTDGSSYPFVAASQPSTGAGSTDGMLKYPSSVAIDPISGNLLVSDTGNDRIQKLSATDLSYISQSGTYGYGDTNLINPVGLAFDQWGNLWLGDNGSDRLKRIGEAPVVTLDSAPTTTTAASIAITYTQTDPGADCDVASGANQQLVIGSNTIVVTCTNAQGQGTDSVTIDRGTPPVVSISSPTDGSSTTATSTSVAWTTTGTGPIACTVNGAPATSPATVSLALGANNIAVGCTNTFGSDTKSVAVTRTAPVVVPPTPGAVSLKLPKKFKLSKKKVKFSVICPDGCAIRSRFFFGTEGGRVQKVRRAASPSSQSVTVKLSKRQLKKARTALANKKPVYLSVAVESYKATQGKTGKTTAAK